MPPRPNLSSTSRALLFVNTIVVLDTSGAKLVQARPDIKRIHIDVSAHRTQQSFFQVFKICGGNNLVLSGIKFEFLEIFSIFQSLHSMVNHFLVDLFLLFLVWEYSWFASHLIHIQDYLLKNKVRSTMSWEGILTSMVLAQFSVGLIVKLWHTAVKPLQILGGPIWINLEN